MPEFVPGIELARAFHEEAVGPLLRGVRYSAALLGYGSEILGFDDARSTDHGWGPRLQVFVEPDDLERVGAAIDAGLPDDFHGWPTRFGWDDVTVSHHVQVVPLGDWLRETLGFDPRAGISTRDWLTTPQQLMLEVTAGGVFHDGLGELFAVREQLAWYPDEVWLWLLACQWRRIDQEEPFVGRAAEAGDELGSRLIAARLARDAIRLCFLLERRYAPYSKWLGTAFRGLDAYESVGAPLAAALAASDFPVREAALVEAAEALADRHNEVGLTRPLETTVRLFHGRPFRVLGSGRFVEACLEQISDADLRSLPLVGGIDQWADSTDVLSYPPVVRRTGLVYGRPS